MIIVINVMTRPDTLRMCHITADLMILGGLQSQEEFPSGDVIHAKFQSMS